MRLSLTPSELDRLTDLVETLHAPFDFPDVDAWRHSVNHHARLLLDAHKVVFMLPSPGHAPVYCQRLDPDGFRAYLDYYHRFDVAGSIALERSLPVSSLLEIHGRDEFYASEYYNDFMRVWNCNHSVGLVAPIDGEPGYAYLGILRDKRQDPPFDARARAILRFLHPAFRAGIHTYLRLAADRSLLGSLLDLSGKRLLLCDERGRPLQRSAALERTLGADPERGLLERHMDELAVTIADFTVRRRPSDELLSRSGAQTVTTARGRYRLSASLAGERGSMSNGILVLVEPLFREAMTDFEIRQRFGLTAQEVRVAREIADGLRNDAIASRLGISPHTARRHTERVLDKLGIASRAQVVERITRN